MSGLAKSSITFARWTGSIRKVGRCVDGARPAPVGLVLVGCVGFALALASPACSREPVPEEPRPRAAPGKPVSSDRRGQPPGDPAREKSAAQPVPPSKPQKEHLPPPPKTLRFYHVPRLGPLPPPEPNFRQVKLHGGRRYAVGASLWGSISYPPLCEGDVVPMRGALYRVGKDKYGHFPVLRLLDEQDVPPGVSVQRDSLVLPLREPATWKGELLKAVSLVNRHSIWLYNSPVLVKWIIRPRLAPDVPVAMIEVDRPFLPDTSRAGQQRRSYTVRSGDVIEIEGHRHRVRNIVPPDPEHQVIGWVELDPDPLPDETEQKE